MDRHASRRYAHHFEGHTWSSMASLSRQDRFRSVALNMPMSLLRFIANTIGEHTPPRSVIGTLRSRRLTERSAQVTTSVLTHSAANSSVSLALHRSCSGDKLCTVPVTVVSIEPKGIAQLRSAATAAERNSWRTVSFL